MANQEAKFIERIEIKGLWNRYDVDWQLNPDVNILVGENGTGKSTILDIIFRLTKVNGRGVYSGKTTNSQSVDEDFNKFNYCKLVTNYNTEIISLLDKSNNLKSIKTTREGIEPLTSILDKIRTFDDIDSKRTNDSNQYSQYDRKNFLLTPLDEELDERITNYVEYRLIISNKILNQKQSPQKVFHKWILFKENINRLFVNTGKSIDENENRIAFILEEGSKILPFQLSSGEKQLLIILLTVLCQDEKPSILLLDEPEISLHVSWQYELIKIIRTLNPNCQLIIVTHSTSIFTKGWMDKIFFMTGKEGILHPIAEKV